MAETVEHGEHVNSQKCSCCHRHIKKIKHAVNLFGDKSRKEGIKEGLELYGGIRVEDNEEDDVGVLYVCQQCYNLIHSIVERIKKLRGICCQLTGKHSVCQRSPSQLTLSPSCGKLPQKRQREKSTDIKQCLFPPAVSSDIIPRLREVDYSNRV